MWSNPVRHHIQVLACRPRHPSGFSQDPLKNRSKGDDETGYAGRIGRCHLYVHRTVEYRVMERIMGKGMGKNMGKSVGKGMGKAVERVMGRVVGRVESNLVEGEKIQVEVRTHWIRYTGPSLLLASTLLGKIFPELLPGEFLAVLFSSSYLGPEFGKPDYFLIFGASGLAWLLLALLKGWSTRLWVTSKRVITRSGVLSRHTSELYLEWLESIEVQQSLLGRLLGFGTVTVTGTGGGYREVSGIENPLVLRRRVFEMAELARSRILSRLAGR
ncbi:MAG: PH domain-containing protein [Magnetococcales bacterium]|nr:PH domain-containing protein [Magnetococcales bacterium]MBF0156698.1 PH domain-containing protein [Magnetococcales bacterium]